MFIEFGRDGRYCVMVGKWVGLVGGIAILCFTPMVG